MKFVEDGISWEEISKKFNKSIKKCKNKYRYLIKNPRKPKPIKEKEVKTRVYRRKSDIN